MPIKPTDPARLHSTKKKIGTDIQETIAVLAIQCGHPVVFDSVQAALAFVRMLAHNITPASFIEIMHSMNPANDGLAKAIVTACMGSPS